MNERSRPIPTEAKQLTTREFEMWCEKAGRFEDDGYDGESADRHALFLVYDESWCGYRGEGW